MDLFEMKIKKEVDKRIKELISMQQIEGNWDFCFEGGLLTDAYMIILLRVLEIDNEEKLIQELVNRLMVIQNKNGTWSVAPDEMSGDLSCTVLAYTAILYSGLYSPNHPNLRKAKRFIKQQGGLSNTHFMTKWMLAVIGQYKWPAYFYIPMTFMLLPSSSPIHFNHFSSYARVHLLPMIIAANKKFTINNRSAPSLNSLNLHRGIDEWELFSTTRLDNPFKAEMIKLLNLPKYFHRLGYERAEQYMINRIENDGTLFSYASATFYMIYALLALGYKKESPIIKKAIVSLKNLLNKNCNGVHLENSTSTIWDTSLLSYAFQEAQIPANHPSIQKATKYLVNKQQISDTVHLFERKYGGWGFSHNNTLNPDNDDTSAVLRALTRTAQTDKAVYQSWFTGVSYLLSMQNVDGGWAAFEKNKANPILTFLPIDNAKDAAIDPSTPDLTGRVLEFLGNYCGLTIQHPLIKASVYWLLQQQQTNGSWYGRWGVCYIYGTWAAVTGLTAVGISKNALPIKKATNWLKHIQHSDGGWGESCSSSQVRAYTPLSFSTPSQTAWAVDALIQAGHKNSQEVRRGLLYLLRENQDKASFSYPTGIGLPGQFYINYHSYNKVFPLLAFAHYLQKK
ncbi:terpene cyclase/mutase family protein [Metabacillus malikii]|uniref:Sporulenol synthase n=1 Tax=Metabacillus malikii TaxID=1504265 RepID=A0ABT9ZAQ3_9BACI|nr:prenyltransferase/squalene oxidase repeat-containing protein [Metabacillus malikii]MDQ0228922.1 sporulenol synthase [Metabacillus malikii]